MRRIIASIIVILSASSTYAGDSEWAWSLAMAQHQPLRATTPLCSSWAWAQAMSVTLPDCECKGTDPACPCNAKPTVPETPEPPKACDRCPCGECKPCSCSAGCSRISGDYGAALAEATKASRRLVVFVGPVAARVVVGCDVVRVHTFEGSGTARIVVGVPGLRGDGQLMRYDLTSTATDASILSAGAVVIRATPPAPAVQVMRQVCGPNGCQWVRE